jgi:hypothetical protein
MRVAIDGGAGFDFNGDTWSGPTEIVHPGDSRHGDDLSSVSCVRTTFCIAVGGPDAYTYNGTSWSIAKAIDNEPNDILLSVACVTASFCMATDFTGYTVSRIGTDWSAPKRIDPHGYELSSVSCPATTFCSAVDNSGYAITGT